MSDCSQHEGTLRCMHIGRNFVVEEVTIPHGRVRAEYLYELEPDLHAIMELGEWEPLVAKLLSGELPSGNRDHFIDTDELAAVLAQEISALQAESNSAAASDPQP